MTIRFVIDVILMIVPYSLLLQIILLGNSDLQKYELIIRVLNSFDNKKKIDRWQIITLVPNRSVLILRLRNH